eukprot:TRINITY_DN16479_c0_g1_i1.p1 TRINITY_DN16479_c0_g1~~TRINITY_DN16479_c0_g1_i1.p1  ORF type:complete len:873 (+),score=120.72 TRINITY_DN16479_c0_g1_i1:56-2620(+)
MSGSSNKADTAHHEGRNILLFNVAVLLMVVYFHHWLPEPLGLDAPSGVFSSGRAMSHLRSMLDLGVRTVGSRSNEILVPQYLLKEFKTIEGSAHASVLMEIDMQWPTGGFTTPFLGTFVNTYDRVTNVVLRLSPRDNVGGDALLVGAHYDSALGTVGASDDLVNIAAMVEIIRLLASKPLKNTIIFNFNGAEETNWQAAHGFITQHKWASQIKAMVNLEASGSGGREMVIQNGPGNAWISRTYAEKVPHPHIHGVAQMIFQSGVLPAQTDFQTYRDHHPTLKKLPGMDLAVVQGGYVYHTPQDDIEHVDAAHVQRLGDNVFALVDALASSPYLRNPGSLKDEYDTTFDVLGIFVVRYSSLVGNLLNVAALVFTAFIVYETKTYDIGKNALRDVILPSFGVAIAAPITVAVVFTLLNQNISWYTSTWLAYVLYTMPSVVGVAVVYHRYGERHVNQSVRTLQTAVVTGATMMFWVILVPLTLCGHTLTTFMILVWFLPLFVKYLCDKVKVQVTSGMYFACCVPGLCIWWHLYLTIIGFFLPLMGRIGNQIPPNVFVAVISGPLVGMLMLIPMSNIFRVPESALKVGLRISIGVFLVGVASSMCFIPIYTTSRPKRLFMQHVQRSWHDAHGTVVKKDAGLWINPMDFNGLAALRREWPALSNAEEATCKAETLYCDYPWYFPVSAMIGGGKWLPAEAPNLPQIELSASGEATDTGRRVAFKIKGPKQMTLIINQRSDQPVVKTWSFSNTVLPPRADCDCHFVFHAKGAPVDLTDKSDLHKHTLEGGETGLRYNYRPFDTRSNWEFTVDLIGSGTLDVAVYGHYLDHPLSDELRKHHESLPQWVSDLAWSSSWSMFKV